MGDHNHDENNGYTHKKKQLYTAFNQCENRIEDKIAKMSIPEDAPHLNSEPLHIQKSWTDTVNRRAIEAELKKRQQVAPETGDVPMADTGFKTDNLIQEAGQQEENTTVVEKPMPPSRWKEKVAMFWKRKKKPSPPEEIREHLETQDELIRDLEKIDPETTPENEKSPIDVVLLQDDSVTTEALDPHHSLESIESNSIQEKEYRELQGDDPSIEEPPVSQPDIEESPVEKPPVSEPQDDAMPVAEEPEEVLDPKELERMSIEEQRTVNLEKVAAALKEMEKPRWVAVDQVAIRQQRLERKRLEEERKRLEQERLAEEARIAEEKRLEEERLERERLAEEARIAEEKRLEEERLERERLAEEARIAEEKRREEERLAKEKRTEEARLAKERLIANELNTEKSRIAQIEEEKRLEEERLEQERLAEEARIAEEKRAEEERLEQERLAEEARIAEEKRAEEEQLARDAQLAKEQRLEAARLTKEQLIADELSAEKIRLASRALLEEEKRAEEEQLARDAQLAKEQRLEAARFAKEQLIADELSAEKTRLANRALLEEEKRAEDARIAEEKRLEEEQLARDAQLAKEQRLEAARFAKEALIANELRLEKDRLAHIVQIEEANEKIGLKAEQFEHTEPGQPVNFVDEAASAEEPILDELAQDPAVTEFLDTFEEETPILEDYDPTTTIPDIKDIVIPDLDAEDTIPLEVFHDEPLQFQEAPLVAQPVVDLTPRENLMPQQGFPPVTSIRNSLLFFIAAVIAFGVQLIFLNGNLTIIDYGVVIALGVMSLLTINLSFTRTLVVAIVIMVAYVIGTLVNFFIYDGAFTVFQLGWFIVIPLFLISASNLMARVKNLFAYNGKPLDTTQESSEFTKES